MLRCTGLCHTATRLQDANAAVAIVAFAAAAAVAAMRY